MKSSSRYYRRALRMMQSETPNINAVVKLLEKGIEEEDPSSKYAIGTWYLHGGYLKKNVRKGIGYIKDAARSGVAPALFDMAVAFETGTGVRKSEKKAAEYYLKAALSGDSEAFYEVGRCLYHGIGFKGDRAQAKIWLDISESKNKT